MTRGRSDTGIAIVIVVALSAACLPSVAYAADDDPAAKAGSLDSLRERFKTGMTQYNRGAFADAIATWEAIYVELGPEKGYRLAFNIASAYEQLAVTHAGTPAAIADANKASDLYEAYVQETTRRHEAGEALEPLIETQEVEAKQHLGSIRIEGEPTIIVRLDEEKIERHAGSVVWVVPGRHVVTFQEGRSAAQVKRVDVTLGKEIIVRFDPVPAKPPIDPTTPPPSVERFITREERPFDKTVLFVSAGATLASVIVPLIFYSNAWSIEDEYVVESSRTRAIELRDEHASARRTAYASLALPAILGAATLGMTAYWFVGTKETRVRVPPPPPVTMNASITPSGATFGAMTRF